MRFIAVTVVLILAASAMAQGQGFCTDAPKYGDNTAASGTAKVNGVSLYYESYGQGSPLLIIHGNGGSIDRLRCQIAFFSKTRRVIAADSRSHGNSENGPEPLTYEQIADDLAALMQTLGVQRFDVLGHSDGGVVALLLAIRHPSQIGKVVSSSPNLTPEDIIPAWLDDGPRKQLALATERIAAGDQTQDWKRLKMQKTMVLNEPHLTLADVGKIAAPTLIMGADNDAMPTSHFVQIAAALQHGQLAIVPGATHGFHREQHELYNALAKRFLDSTVPGQ